MDRQTSVLLSNEIERRATAAYLSGQLECKLHACEVDVLSLIGNTPAARGPKIVRAYPPADREGIITCDYYSCIQVIIGFKVLEVDIADFTSKNSRKPWWIKKRTTPFSNSSAPDLPDGHL